MSYNQSNKNIYSLKTHTPDQIIMYKYNLSYEEFRKIDGKSSSEVNKIERLIKGEYSDLLRKKTELMREENYRMANELFNTDTYKSIIRESESTLEKVKDFNFEPILNVDPGTVIFVDRGIYEHYGIYSGKNKVIHYSEESFGKGRIRETHISNFLGNQSECKQLQIDGHFSNQESLKRAKARIGESKYDLIFNNCEHFAIWCKTGKKESSQINLISFGIGWLLSGL